jgi:hypothetical protein
MNQVIQEGAEEVDVLSDDDEDVKEEEDDEVEAAGANYTSSYFDDADAERADTDEVVDLEPDVAGNKAKPKIRPQQRIIQAKTGPKTSDASASSTAPQAAPNIRLVPLFLRKANHAKRLISEPKKIPARHEWPVNNKNTSMTFILFLTTLTTRMCQVS